MTSHTTHKCSAQLVIGSLPWAQAIAAEQASGTRTHSAATLAWARRVLAPAVTKPAAGRAGGAESGPARD